MTQLNQPWRRGKNPMKPEPKSFEWCVSERPGQWENTQYQYLSRLSDVAAPTLRAGKNKMCRRDKMIIDVAAPTLRAGKNQWQKPP